MAYTYYHIITEKTGEGLILRAFKTGHGRYPEKDGKLTRSKKKIGRGEHSKD